MLIRKGTIPDQRPGFVFRGMGTTTFVVFSQSCFEIGTVSEVGLFRKLLTTQDVCVMHNANARASLSFLKLRRAPCFALACSFMAAPCVARQGEAWWRRRESNPRPQWSHLNFYVCILPLCLAKMTADRHAITLASLSIDSPVAPETHTPDYPAVDAPAPLAGVRGGTRGLSLGREC